jgi:hypothetical protein
VSIQETIEGNVGVWAPHFITFTVGEVLMDELFPWRDKVPDSMWYQSRVGEPIVTKLAAVFGMDPIIFAEEADKAILEGKDSADFLKEAILDEKDLAPFFKEAQGGGADRLANANFLLRKYSFLSEYLSDFEVKVLSKLS